MKNALGPILALCIVGLCVYLVGQSVVEEVDTSRPVIPIRSLPDGIPEQNVQNVVQAVKSSAFSRNFATQNKIGGGAILHQAILRNNGEEYYIRVFPDQIEILYRRINTSIRSNQYSVVLADDDFDGEVDVVQVFTTGTPLKCERPRRPIFTQSERACLTLGQAKYRQFIAEILRALDIEWTDAYG